jgi:hypothetical protein
MLIMAGMHSSELLVLRKKGIIRLGLVLNVSPMKNCTEYASPRYMELQ